MKKLMAFLNWNQRFVLSANGFDRLAGFLPNSASPSGPESGGGQFPARFFAPSGSVKTSATTEGRSRQAQPNRLPWVPGPNSVSIRKVLYLSVVLGKSVVWAFRDFSSLRTHFRGLLLYAPFIRDYDAYQEQFCNDVFLAYKMIAFGLRDRL
jgi:hypothetical protein